MPSILLAPASETLPDNALPFSVDEVGLRAAASRATARADRRHAGPPAPASAHRATAAACSGSKRNVLIFRFEPASFNSPSVAPSIERRSLALSALPSQATPPPTAASMPRTSNASPFHASFMSDSRTEFASRSSDELGLAGQIAFQLRLREREARVERNRRLRAVAEAPASSATSPPLRRLSLAASSRTDTRTSSSLTALTSKRIAEPLGCRRRRRRGLRAGGHRCCARLWRRE